ncbi:unnamed protein product [Nesidiocoris tenuis]|uniref:Uncharacterized protein n=1 Tax=Nesidiocoris tenuis TaxID=355587 RepID=A0A6H5HSP2_9HEMI|nr:unnamed protein product [Nesidiocoris tenuis]
MNITTRFWYKAKAVQVYSRICQLEGKADHADRLIKRQFQYRGPGPVPITRALEKFVNKTRQFPNFRDVLQLVKKVNSDEGLGYNAAQVKNIKKFNIKILKFAQNEKTPHFRNVKNIHIFCKFQICPSLYFKSFVGTEGIFYCAQSFLILHQEGKTQQKRPVGT